MVKCLKFGGEKMSEQNKGKLSLLAASFLWGFGFIAVQDALDSGWTPFGLLAMRGLIAGILFFFLSYKTKWWRNRKVVVSGILGGILMFSGFIFQTYGQAYSTPANAAFLTTLYVIFTPFLVRLLFKVKLKPKVFVAALIAIIGLGVLNLKDGYQVQTGDVLLLICAFLFALHIIALEKMGEYIDPLSLTAIQTLTMGILSLIAMFLMKENLQEGGWLGVLYSGLISSGAASFLQAHGQKRVNASLASLILTMEAIFGVLCSVWLLGEELTINMLIGGTLLLLAVLIIEIKRK
jgi:Permeases of the drug/metabolite transporter (DMT) superfamily